jgi:hypothetical protein
MPASSSPFACTFRACAHRCIYVHENLNMQHPLSLRAAGMPSASSLLSYPYQFALAQNAAAGFDVFVMPTGNKVVNAGSNFDIIWTPSDPAWPVTIRLLQGYTELTQQFGPTIACKHGIPHTSSPGTMGGIC